MADGRLRGRRSVKNDGLRALCLQNLRSFDVDEGVKVLQEIRFEERD